MTASNPSPIELASIQTKKIWEKVIGAKFNSNDEINHIAQQEALTNIGLNMITRPTQGRTGKR